MAKRYKSMGAGPFSLPSGPTMPKEIISREVMPMQSSNFSGQYPDTFEDIDKQISSDVSKMKAGFKIGKF